MCFQMLKETDLSNRNFKKSTNSCLRIGCNSLEVEVIFKLRRTIYFIHELLYIENKINLHVFLLK